MDKHVYNLIKPTVSQRLWTRPQKPELVKIGIMAVVVSSLLNQSWSKTV